MNGNMKASKAHMRRQKMAVFGASVDAEKERLGGLNLSLAELVDMFHCGNFFTELAAAHWVLRWRDRDPEAVMAAMLDGLSHPRWKVRRTCADYMDHWGDQRCVEPLLLALKDPKEHVRRLALHSLSCQQCKAHRLEGDWVPHLIEMATHDRSARVRRIATGTLGAFLGDERAIAALTELAEDTKDAVVAARARASLDRLAVAAACGAAATG